MAAEILEQRLAAIRAIQAEIAALEAAGRGGEANRLQREYSAQPDQVISRYIGVRTASLSEGIGRADGGAAIQRRSNFIAGVNPYRPSTPELDTLCGKVKDCPDPWTLYHAGGDEFVPLTVLAERTARAKA